MSNNTGGGGAYTTPVPLSPWPITLFTNGAIERFEYNLYDQMIQCLSPSKYCFPYDVLCVRCSAVSDGHSAVFTSNGLEISLIVMS